MQKVPVYAYCKYDGSHDEMRRGQHMATREFIKDAGVILLEGTDRLIEKSLVDRLGRAPLEIQPDPVALGRALKNRKPN